MVGSPPIWNVKLLDWITLFFIYIIDLTICISSLSALVLDFSLKNQPILMILRNINPNKLESPVCKKTNKSIPAWKEKKLFLIFFVLLLQISHLTSCRHFPVIAISSTLIASQGDIRYPPSSYHLACCCHTILNL